jgi:hypothetical protein
MLIRRETFVQLGLVLTRSRGTWLRYDAEDFQRARVVAAEAAELRREVDRLADLDQRVRAIRLQKIDDSEFIGPPRAWLDARHDFFALRR